MGRGGGGGLCAWRLPSPSCGEWAGEGPRRGLRAASGWAFSGGVCVRGVRGVGGKRCAPGGFALGDPPTPRGGEWAGKGPGGGGARRREWVFRTREFQRKIPAGGQALRATRAAGGTRRWMVLEAGAGARAGNPACCCCCSCCARGRQVRGVNVNGFRPGEGARSRGTLACLALLLRIRRRPVAPLDPGCPNRADWLELAGRPNRARRLVCGLDSCRPQPGRSSHPPSWFRIAPGVWGEPELLHQSPFTPLGSVPLLRGPGPLRGLASVYF